MGTELAEYRAEAEAKLAAELESKKEELQKLAAELHIEKTLGDVEEMSIEFIDKQIAMFKEIIDNKPKVPQFTGDKQHHQKEGKVKGQYNAVLKAFKGD